MVHGGASSSTVHNSTPINRPRHPWCIVPRRHAAPYSGCAANGEPLAGARCGSGERGTRHFVSNNKVTSIIIAASISVYEYYTMHGRHAACSVLLLLVLFTQKLTQPPHLACKRESNYPEPEGSVRLAFTPLHRVKSLAVKDVSLRHFASDLPTPSC